MKSAIILFFSLLLAYLPFSRTPDYFDSEISSAIIIKKGSAVLASFTEEGKTYYIPLPAKKFQSKTGQRVEIIYELNQPEHAKLNQAWNYWLVPSELAFALGIFIVLLGVAYATTHRPDPSALAEQLEYKKENTGKYN